MERSEITGAVVTQAEALLAEGAPHAAIAAQLGMTEYVVGLIAGPARGRGPAPKSQSTGRRLNSTPCEIDAATIRRIQRMLAVGWLSRNEIAREAGVSRNLVSEVARGKRKAQTLRQQSVAAGEVFLARPIRCGKCGALLSIVPCRACRTRLAAMVDRWLGKNLGGFSKMPFRTVQVFDSLLEELPEPFGGHAVQSLIPLLSAELAAFAAAKDKREHVIARAEKFFDEFVEPIDLPGPDRLIDPALRAAIRPIVGRLYDEVLKKMEAQNNAA